MPRRRLTAAEVRAVLEPSVAAVGCWVEALDALDAPSSGGPHPAALDAPSVLAGWSRRDLVAHVVVVADSVVHLAPLPPSASTLSISEYLAGYADGAAAITARTQQAAADSSDLAAAYAQRWEAGWQHLDALADVERVRARRGPARLADFLVTRVVEMVVHGDDLARSFPELAPPEVPASATRLVARTLLDVLAERHPGQSLEVRVPPVAAVQCMPGPRHTRGTPGSVVETDALTWVRLAAGRQSWAQARDAGRVSASGERGDLSAVLPLL